MGESETAALLRRGIDSFGRGDLNAAETALAQVLRREPDQLQALSILGAIHLRSGRAKEAVTHFGRAAALSPSSHVAQSNFGLSLRDAGRTDEALATFDKALAIKPDYVVAIYNRALTLADLGRRDEALAVYQRVLALEPGHAETLNNRGLLLQAAGDLASALKSYDLAIAARPAFAEAHNNRGTVLKELRRLQDALASHDRAAAITPDYAAAHYNRALVLLALGQLDAALTACDRALALEPGSADALNNRALILRDLRRHSEALADCDQALAIRPDFTEALSNRGVILQELQRPAEALASFDRALSLQPDTAAAWHNRGHALRGLARYDDAIASYDRAIAMKPDYAEAHFNAGLCRLMVGDFARGWAQYEWRGFNEAPRAFPAPAWNGTDDIAGKTILLHAEQGLGDTIQFVRYVEMVAARGAAVVLEAPAALTRLLSQVPGISKLIATGAPLPRFDLQCRLMSLPGLFATRRETIPASPRYLAADPALRQKWADALGPAQGPRIGLVWSGNPTHKNDRNRSIPLAAFRDILQPGASFVSLHRELRPGEADELAALSIRHFGDALTDFAETAALIENLDLVIAVDTSVAHLAGALGKPVWLLLPFEPDWRWFLQRDDSPWYPSARLFRQPTHGDWPRVVVDIKAALSDWIAART